MALIDLPIKVIDTRRRGFQTRPRLDESDYSACNHSPRIPLVVSPSNHWPTGKINSILEAPFSLNISGIFQRQ